MTDLEGGIALEPRIDALRENRVLSASRAAVPILMYHKVGADVHNREGRFLNVSGSDFRRQMQALTRLGYKARTFAEIVEARQKGLRLPPRVCAITFDDGYGCIGDIAAPILHKFGFPGTVFVVSQGAGQSNAWDAETGHAVLPLLDYDALRQLQQDGWEIAGHTRTHPHLDALDDRAALNDICAGKAEIEVRLGIELATFCYPFGHYNARTPELVRQAGYSGACTTKSGLLEPHTNLFLVPRIKVAYRDGVFGMLYRMLVRPSLPTTRRKRRDTARR